MFNGILSFLADEIILFFRNPNKQDNTLLPQLNDLADNMGV